MAKTHWRGDAAPVPQVDHVTPANIEIGDTFTLTINRKDVTVTATDTTVATLIGLLVTAVNDSEIAEFQELTASVGTNATTGDTTHLVLTGPDDGKPFTLTSSASDAGNLDVSVVETVTGNTGQNEIQLVTLGGAANGGNYTLTAFGDTTAAIDYNANAATVQSALEGTANIAAGDVTVTGDAGGPWSVEFEQAYALTDVALMTGNGANITKAAGAYPVVITSVTQGDPGLNEKQQVTLPGTPTGGTFTLAFDGTPTANIAYDANAAAVDSALEAVMAAGDVSVTGDAGGPYVVEFTGNYLNTNVPPLVGNGAALTGVAAVTVVTTTAGHPLTNDVYRVTFGGAGIYQFFIHNHLSVEDVSGTFPIPTSAVMVEAAIAAASSVGSGNVRVTTISTYVFDVEFLGDLAGVAMTNFGFQVGTGTVSHTTTGGEAGANEVQKVSLAGSPTGGTFTLTFRGQTTGNLTYDESAADVQTGLAALSTIGANNVSVAGNSGGPWTVAFQGTLASQDVPAITGNAASLTGGTLSISTVQAATAATDESQKVTLFGSPAGGTFTLTYSGQTTANVAYNATASVLETTIENLSNVDAVAVIGDAGGPWTVTFQGTLAGTNVVAMTGNGALLSGAEVIVDVTQEAADPVDEIQTITLDGSPTGGTFTLTFDSQTTANIAYNASAGVIQNALEALSSVDIGEVAVSGSAGSPWTVLFQSTLGHQDVSAISGNADGLTSTGTQSFTATTYTSPTGPNWFDDAENWSGNAVPVDGDSIVFDGRAGADCLYGISQANTSPAEIIITSEFSPYKIGLLPHNGSYYEYRETYLTLGVSGDAQKITITIGEGSGSGSGRIKLNTGTAETEFLILGTGTAEGDLPAVLWKGTHASNIARVYKGSFGAAVYQGEEATINELEEGYQTDRDSDSEVLLGDDVTLGTVQKTGGVLTVGGEANAAITSFEQTAGETTINGSDGVTALEATGGTVFYCSTGTIGGNPILAGDAILDFSRDMRAKTVTNPIEIYGDDADVNDPYQTVSNLRIDYNETTRLANLGQNFRLTRGAAA